MRIKSISFTIFILVLSSSANSALLSRLGGLAYYDTDTDLTWLADASAGGQNTWTGANSWARNLSVAGVTGWRLPDVQPVNGATFTLPLFGSNIGTTDTGYNISAPGTLYAGSTASEMAYLYYNTLGNLSICDPILSTESFCSRLDAGWGLTNTGPFSNLHGEYWSSDERIDNGGQSFLFSMDYGAQGREMTNQYWEVWAVHSGDVESVPIPTAIWLFGSGLLGLIGVAKRKKS